MEKLYEILLTATAKKQLQKLPTNITDKLIVAIQALAKNPRPEGYKKLKGRPGFRIRKGDYRIIYEIFDDKLIVSVIAVAHRKDVYE
ncbi:MAG: type II toxin-antitoxin system RelE/ParE family toxin [Ferruginibacter sp.]